MCNCCTLLDIVVSNAWCLGNGLLEANATNMNVVPCLWKFKVRSLVYFLVLSQHYTCAIWCRNGLCKTPQNFISESLYTPRSTFYNLRSALHPPHSTLCSESAISQSSTRYSNIGPSCYGKGICNNEGHQYILMFTYFSAVYSDCTYRPTLC